MVLGKDAERTFIMKPKISHQKYYKLALLGYILFGECCNGFYQYIYFHDESLPPTVWILGAFIGSVILVAKNILGSTNKFRSILIDFSFIIPVLFIPKIPPRHDITMILMLVYACVFVVVYFRKNYYKVD